MQPSAHRHTDQAWLYSLSRMLECAAYYGLRAITVLYMVGETLGMDRNTALTTYGWISISLVYSRVLGGILGDLLVGNRKSIIIGGLLQAAGAFSLCIPSTAGLYAGLAMVVLGSGLFAPNFRANFGKLYFDRTRLLDAGFTLVHLAGNLGAFLGILLIGLIGEFYGYNIGFLISGILMLISLVPIIFATSPSVPEKVKPQTSMQIRILLISFVILAMGLFWSLFELPQTRIMDIQTHLKEGSDWGIPPSLWNSVNMVIVFPISLIAVVAWTHFYSSQFFKLMLGFLFGALAISLLIIIPEYPNTQHTAIFLLSCLLLSVAEVHVEPILFSILTLHANPKYLAILMGLTFAPFQFISFLFSYLDDSFYNDPNLAISTGAIGMGVMGIVCAGFLFWNRKSRAEEV